MNIEIDNHLADKIHRQIMVEDYEMNCREARELLGRIDLRPFEQDDLAMVLDNMKAFEVLIRYYFCAREAEEIIARNRGA